MRDMYQRVSGRVRAVRGRRSPGLDRRAEDGAAAVEFAMLVPFLLLLTFGLIQYGFYFWAMQGGSDIARSAARMSAVGEPATCSAFRDEVTGIIERFGAAEDDNATVSRGYENGPGNSSTDVEVGDVVTVTVTFESVDLGLPIIPFIDGGRVTETVETRVEYVPTQPEACA